MEDSYLGEAVGGQFTPVQDSNTGTSSVFTCRKNRFPQPCIVASKQRYPRRGRKLPSGSSVRVR